MFIADSDRLVDTVCSTGNQCINQWYTDPTNGSCAILSGTEISSNSEANYGKKKLYFGILTFYSCSEAICLNPACLYDSSWHHSLLMKMVSSTRMLHHCIALRNIPLISLLYTLLFLSFLIFSVHFCTELFWGSQLHWRRISGGPIGSFLCVFLAGQNLKHFYVLQKLIYYSHLL